MASSFRVETLTREGRQHFDELEKEGMEHQAKNTVFMLVAGGLGERLNYPVWWRVLRHGTFGLLKNLLKGIKVGLPVEITTGMCYLEYYIRCILSLQSRGE